MKLNKEELELIKSSLSYSRYDFLRRDFRKSFCKKYMELSAYIDYLIGTLEDNNKKEFSLTLD